LGNRSGNMCQLKIELKEEFKHFQKSPKNPSCRYAVIDQNGNPVCMRNFECPGFCDGKEKCPYV